MTAKISAIRNKIAGLQAELAITEAAGRPVNDTLPRVGELLDHLSQPYTAGIAMAAKEIIAARVQDVSLRQALNLTFNEAGFAVGAVAQLLKNHIMADLEAEIARIAEAMPQPLSDAEQSRKLSALRASIRALEREEEGLIEAEEAAGNHVDRRPDADPVAVLNIPDGICEEFAL